MANELFSLNKETWETSIKEKKPIVFIFQEKCCEHCLMFTKKVLDAPTVQQFLYSHFTPIFIDVNIHPDIFEKYMDSDLIHPVYTVNGVYLGSCQDKSSDAFLKALDVFHEQNINDPTLITDIPRIKTPYMATRHRTDFLVQQTDQAARFLLEWLIDSYDALWGGWGKGNIKYPLTDEMNFLLYYFYRSEDKRLFEMCKKTIIMTIKHLQAPDHLYYRYSKSRDWSVIGSYQKKLSFNIDILYTLIVFYQMHTKVKDDFFDLILENVEKGTNTLITKLRLPNKFFCNAVLDYDNLSIREEIPFTNTNCKLIRFLLTYTDLFYNEYYSELARTMIDGITEFLESNLEIPHVLKKDFSCQVWFLKDQVSLLKTLLKAYGSFGEPTYLQLAEDFSVQIIKHYYDTSIGLFKERHMEQSFGIYREINYPFKDNILMAENLLVLEEYTAKEFSRIAKNVLITLAVQTGVSKNAPLPPEFVRINRRAMQRDIQLIVIGKRDNPSTLRLFKEAKRLYEIFKIVQLLDPIEDKELIERKKIKPVTIKPALYIIIDDIVSKPIFYPREIRKIIDQISS